MMVEDEGQLQAMRAASVSAFKIKLTKIVIGAGARRCEFGQYSAK